MKGFLKRLLFGPDPRTADHPVFGKLTLMETKSGAYWEAEPEFDGDTLAVGIDTSNGEEPTQEQLRFYSEIVDDLGAAFARAAPVLVPEYEKWVRQPFPADWKAAFKFAGLSIPVNGDDKGDWELQFDCLTDKAGHMFTCYFEDGHPCKVSIDG